MTTAATMADSGAQDWRARAKDSIAFERLLTTLATEFITLPLPEIQAGIHRALAQMGAAVGVDRCYLLEVDAGGQHITRVNEWGAPGVVTASERLVGAPLTAFAWAAPQLLAGDAVAVADVAALPEEAVAERAEAMAQGTRAFCMVPVRRGTRTVGALGFDAVHAPRAWSATVLAVLRRAAAVFANALERQALELEVRRQGGFHQLMASLATEFINLPSEQIDAGIERALGRIGAYVNVDRAFVFQRDAEPDPVAGPTMSETHEWCAPGTPAVFAAYQRVPDAAVRWYLERLEAGREFRFPRTDPDDPILEIERQVYEAEGVQSLVCVPLRRDGATMGFLGLVSLHVPQDWTTEQVALLHMAAEMISNALARRRLEQEVLGQRRFEQLVTALATGFINLPVEQTDAGIDDALRRLGEFGVADRTYLFEFDPAGHTLSNTHEWTAAGITAEADRVQGVPVEAFPWFVPRILAGETIHVPDVEALPPEAAAEQAEFRAQAVRSLVCVPVRRAGQTVGFVGADAVRGPRRWSAAEISYLQVTAALFANIWARRQADVERQRLAQQVQQAQKLESLGVLAGGIAHDFNNLLTTMLGNASLALEDLPPEAGARYSLEQIRIAAERARDLTNQMLAYAGRGRVQVERLDLSAIVQEIADLLRVSVGKRTRLEFGLLTGLPEVAADVTQVRQVVMNLLTNAAEALGEQGGTVAIRTTACTFPGDLGDAPWMPASPPPGAYVLLEVADTGCGMDAATRARIFDPFFSTKFAGRGLGLAAVLGIVQSNGGALRVTSAPGAGTTFSVAWPAAQGPAPAAVAPGAPAAPRPGHGMVLVIDDEAGVRAVSGSALQRAGYQVQSAPSGRQGVAAFRRHADEIALILLDLEMPDQDGVATLAALRAVRPDVPVILSSGYTEHDALSRFGEAGLQGFLQKPYTASQLRAAVQHVLTAPGE